MDTKTRVESLLGKARRISGERLAEKDFSWWASAIAEANTAGRRECTDASRSFYRSHKRHSVEYIQSLYSLLGDGFTIVLDRAWTSTGVDVIYYPCIRIRW